MHSFIRKRWEVVQGICLGGAGKGIHEVKFIDFVNVEKVKTEDLLKLPAHLLAFEPQAIKCAFAYIRLPSADKQCGNEAAKYV